MQRFVSLLRGINVSGQKKIRMADLRSLYAALGFTEVVSYLQSGNVVFDTSAKRAGLGAKIEGALQAAYGFEVPVQIRSAREMTQLANGNAFLAERGIDAGHLHVTFLAKTPAASAWARLDLDSAAPERLVRRKGELYVYCPNGYGRAKLNNNYIERKLGIAATTRNWKSVLALAELVAGG